MGTSQEKYTNTGPGKISTGGKKKKEKKLKEKKKK